MATKAQETPDEFDTAFASFAAGPGGTAPDPEPAPAAETGDGEPGVGADTGADGAAAADPADPAGGATGVDSGDAGAADGSGDPPPAAGDPPAAAPDDGATDALIARLAGLVKEAPAPAPAAAPAAPAAAEPELYTPEEKEFLTTYDKDWGDVTRGEALKRRAENNAMVQYVFGQVAQELKPYLETIELLSTRAHLGDIRATVGDDYDALRDKVVAWATGEQQPAYLQNAYKQVIQSGTAEEVNDLINRYRAATGPAPTPTAQPELSNDAKKAAQALAPVTTKRSAIPQDDSADDFDAAFKRWAQPKQT